MPDQRPDRTIASSLLRPGHNCWRVEPADRAAVVTDAAAYFEAAKAAMEQARFQILLLAWDFDPGTHLEPQAPHPPDRLRRFLATLLRRQPNLEIYVLKWDLAALFTLSEKQLPAPLLSFFIDPRLHYRLDYNHPPHACHHQKLLVIDDRVAFCGGMDFSDNRWDTRAHRPHSPYRRRLDGTPYEPHHDVMMLVEGRIARRLGDLARERWHLATGHTLPAPSGASTSSADRWPQAIVPTLWNVPVAIARTAPAWNGRPEVREIEALYLDSIAAARRTIYLESQYLTSHSIGEALAARLGEPDGPEIVVVNPQRAPSWLEHATMDVARARLARRLSEADRYGRFRLYTALDAAGGNIVVHSKLMIVDDRILRIGSANLSNRSMSLDTECDLAIDAGAVADPVAQQALHRTITDHRDNLVAEHLGVSPARLRETIVTGGSLIRAIEMLRNPAGRRLEPCLPSATTTASWPTLLSALVDPQRPRLRRSLQAALGLSLILAGTVWLWQRRRSEMRGRHRA